MMMSLSWLYHLKEEFGSHQGSTYENFIQKSIFYTGVIAVQFSKRDILQAVRKALLLINFLGPYFYLFLKFIYLFLSFFFPFPTA